MKLRILDDSLRLRLSQGELERLRTLGRVEAAIGFGPGPSQQLVYALTARGDGEMDYSALATVLFELAGLRGGQPRVS